MTAKKTPKKMILFYSLLFVIISHFSLIVLSIIFSNNSHKVSTIQTYHGILYFYNFFINFLFDYDNIALGISASIILDYLICAALLLSLRQLTSKIVKWYAIIIACVIFVLIKIALAGAFLP
ncbi:MAG TPA: hypothetical protein PLA54_06480 [Spirochaetota bacterium]|nr:hypothetical protein [Spirochaetota bacterium]